MRRIALVSIAICLLGLSCRKGPDLTEPLVVTDRPIKGGTDITFFFAADSHVGADGMADAQRKQIESMNALPGTAYPPQIGGVVGKPLGLLLAGDLTDWGTDAQWNAFAQLYGLSGDPSLLNYPLYECTGNHDRGMPGSKVPGRVEKRHDGLAYSWDWQDVHLICLGQNPNLDNLPWLRRDLAKVGTRVPVVIWFHYNLQGPFSDFWPENEKDAFAQAIKGYNVLGVFHGHWHSSRYDKWRGLDDFQAGSPRHGQDYYLVVHITDKEMTVASWNWRTKRWYWAFTKEINGAPSAAVGKSPALTAK